MAIGAVVPFTFASALLTSPSPSATALPLDEPAVLNVPAAMDLSIDEEFGSADFLGNPVSDAVARYAVDPYGSLYEVHSPQTLLPRLASPKSQLWLVIGRCDGGPIHSQPRSLRTLRHLLSLVRGTCRAKPPCVQNAPGPGPYRRFDAGSHCRHRHSLRDAGRQQADGHGHLRRPEIAGHDRENPAQPGARRPRA